VTIGGKLGNNRLDKLRHLFGPRAAAAARRGPRIGCGHYVSGRRHVRARLARDAVQTLLPRRRLVDLSK